jgi:flagellin-specific chaperone FliS
MLGRLTFVDVRNDPEPAREVIALLEPLRESWNQIARGGDKPAASSAGTLPPGGLSVSA